MRCLGVEGSCWALIKFPTQQICSFTTDFGTESVLAVMPDLIMDIVSPQWSEAVDTDDHFSEEVVIEPSRPLSLEGACRIAGLEHM